MAIEIEKGVPIPPIKAAKNTYPYREMQVGDSFFIPGKKSSEVTTHSKSTGHMKFTRRTVVENGVKGVRVWRFA